MEKLNLEVRFQKLEESMHKIKSLLAWKQLKQEESLPGQPAAFVPYDPTEEDLRNEYTFFLVRVQELRYILNHEEIIPLAKSKRENYKRQLAKIENQVKFLQVTETLKNP